jgi:dihydrofolate reductase
MEKSMIRAILACDDDWGIGKGGQLPWPNNKADLKWFKETTLNGTVIMGRKTWDSLPFKPLPNRKNIVVSNTMKHQEGIEVIRSDIFNSRMSILSKENNVWMIGGCHLIENNLPIIDEFWLSRINGVYDCEIFLPKTLIELTYELYSSEREGEVYVDKWKKI